MHWLIKCCSKKIYNNKVRPNYVLVRPTEKVSRKRATSGKNESRALIYKSSVCCFTHMHTDINVFHIRHSREMQEIFRRAHNNKRQYFIEPFLIRSVRCKREHFWQSFLSSPLVLSRLTTAVVGFLSGSGSRYAIKFLIWGCITSILAPNITRWYFKLLM